VIYVNVARSIGLLVALSTLLVVVVPMIASAEVARRAEFSVAIDLLGNVGSITANITISAPDCETLAIPLKLFNEEATYTFLYYETYGNLTVLGSDFNESEVVLTAYVCGEGVLSVNMVVSNSVEDYGVGSYALYIDTSALQGYLGDVEVKILFMQTLRASATPISGAVTAEVVDSSVHVRGFGAVLVELYAELEEIPPTPTPTPTTPQTPIPTPTTPTTPTPTPTPTAPTPSPMPTTTPQTPTPVATTPTPPPLANLTLIAISILVVVIVVVALVALRKRR